MKYHLISPRDKSINIIDQIFNNRGIKDKIKYLNPTKDMENNSLLLDNIKQGAYLLLNHILQNHKIVFIVDSDTDGFTSAAILINYIWTLYPECNITYLLHDGKQHGLNDMMDKIDFSVDLVICADSASNDYDAHEILHKQGTDVLCLDHHEADKVSSYACVINNQLCDYPNKSLSGAGVVYKFCQFLDSLSPTLNDLADSFLDLTALGLVGDMMDLTNLETRYYVAYGLATPRNAFIKEIMKKNDFKIQGELSPFKIAFYVAPFINATIRSGEPQDKLLLFESMLDKNANKLVPSTKRGCFGQEEKLTEQVCRRAGNIKNHQDKTVDDGLAIIEDIIQRKNLLNNKLLIITLESPLEPNIIGLMANKLMGKYKRPVAVLNKGDGIWAGSARGYEKSELKDFKAFLIESGFTTLAQGHANAFGLQIPFENLQPLIDYSNDKLKDMNFETCYLVDAINPTGEDVLEIASLKNIWGQGIEEPYVVFENVNITPDNIVLMAKNTLKISSDIEFIKFNAKPDEYEKLKANDNGCITVDIIGRCAVNEWLGKITPQILMEDFEIKNNLKYYF